MGSWKKVRVGFAALSPPYETALSPLVTANAGNQI